MWRNGDTYRFYGWVIGPAVLVAGSPCLYPQYLVRMPDGKDVRVPDLCLAYDGNETLWNTWRSAGPGRHAPDAA